MIRKKMPPPSGLWMNDIPVYNPITPSGFVNYQTTKLSNYLTLARFPNLLKSR